MKTQHGTRGIGLIEVLIALLVASLGVLAIASLQGDLLLSSGETKARNEARLLAEQKLEELRGMATLDAYTGSDPDEFLSVCNGEIETIQGKNAEFSRICMFDDTEPEPRAVTIEISWDNKSGSQSLVMNSEIVWNDPTMGVLFADASEEAASPALAPSPNANSSVLGGDDVDGGAPSSQILPNTDLAPENANFQNIHQGFDSDGNRVVFDTETNEVLLTCFGHVVHSVSGNVHTTQGKNLDNVGLDISQYGACRIEPGQTSRPYACFFCGNCSESWGEVDENGNPVCSFPDGGL